MVQRFLKGPFIGMVLAIGSAIWQASTAGGIDQWIGLPFVAFVVSIASSVWSLFRENRLLKDALEPKLEIVFLPPDYAKTPDDEIDFRPFLQTLVFGRLPGGGGTMVKMTDRRYRIGIVNHSKGVVRNVRAVLTDCRPGANYVFPNHRLLAQDTKPPAGEVDVAPSLDGQPTAFFDVVNELHEHDRTPDVFYFCYANEEIRGPVQADSYEIKITVTGDSCRPVSRQFNVYKLSRPPALGLSLNKYRWLRMEST